MLTARPLLKLMHFSGAFAAHWAVWDIRQIGTNPAAVLQIGGRSYVPSAADFVAVFMQEIGAFSARSEIADFGRKGRSFGGQGKRNRHYVGRISEIVLVCTPFRWAATGTMIFGPACRDFAQSLGFAGFRPAP
ncbi:hypothetical protein ACUSIJ_12310 [Pseudochelatococcus sp. B33]